MGDLSYKPPPPSPPAIVRDGTTSTSKEQRPISDERETFSRRSKAEKTIGIEEFIQQKIDAVRGDPRLSPAEKETAIEELRSRK
jgi:hypothetical protein